MFSKPDGREAVAAREAQRCLGMDAQEVCGLNGGEKRLPNLVDFVAVINGLHS